MILLLPQPLIQHGTYCCHDLTHHSGSENIFTKKSSYCSYLEAAISGKSFSKRSIKVLKSLFWYNPPIFFEGRGFSLFSEDVWVIVRYKRSIPEAGDQDNLAVFKTEGQRAAYSSGIQGNILRQPGTKAFVTVIISAAE